jgi:protein-tyrosine phosphatase
VVQDGLPLSYKVLERGITFICDQKAAGKKVLVACGAGISRSVVFAWGALMQAEKLDFFDAYREILEVHPDAQPHLMLCVSLAEYFGLHLSQQEIVNGIYPQ